MKSTLFSILPLASLVLGRSSPGKGSCRFAQDWTQEKILRNTDEFISEVLLWEGNFHQNDIAYNEGNGVSYDGAQLDWVTGEATSTKTFSAASKEVNDSFSRFIFDH